MTQGTKDELVAFGDISTDVLVEVSSLPRQDQKQWARWLGEFPGGMGANVAAAFARLGGSAVLWTSVGDDARGDASLEDLRAFGVDVSNVVKVQGPTFWTIGLVDEQGEKSLLEFATEAFSPPWADVDWSILDVARVAYTTGYEIPDAANLFRECRARGVLTSLDVEDVHPGQIEAANRVLELTDILFCRPATLRALTGLHSAVDAASTVLDRGTQVVVSTLGAEGCAVFGIDEDTVRVPGHDVHVRDTTGAGDCFAGAFLFGMTKGLQMQECAELANFMAAESVTRYGCRGNLLGIEEMRSLAAARGLQVAGLDGDE